MSKVSKSITIDNDLNSRIEELRVAERRTFSGMISIIVENYLRDRGISPDDSGSEYVPQDQPDE